MKKSYNTYRTGIDIGSTTLKIIILDGKDNILHRSYTRHLADIAGTLRSEFALIGKQFPDAGFAISMTGSAGMGVAEKTGLPFVQEVVSSVKVVNTHFPDTRVMIDLGGEDAKMVFFNTNGHPDIRMNGSCAGGTGAFIDQMADLMNIPVGELGTEAAKYTKIYPVASRCGVFAKTDVQNLISRGVPVPDIAMSILYTVALQSITSLARGQDITPRIICTGGPLTFIASLVGAYRMILGLGEEDISVAENSEMFPAWGAALSTANEDAVSYTAAEVEDLTELLHSAAVLNEEYLEPLFRDWSHYSEWKEGRNIRTVPTAGIGDGTEIECFLGIDSGSTTTKVAVMDWEGNLVYKFYDRNEGNPLGKAIEGLRGFYDEAERKGVRIKFLSSAATGYGEDLIRSAFGLDHGIVETMAHLSGARYVDPDVSFILDIGGQDIKSIFTKDGVISNIELNEACSSGCGSFLQNFASTMNMTLPEFTRAACLARKPSDLGTRCTVFMNSKVKQSLRENAGLDDIAAGLAYSVVKNCLYKVLKISNINILGDNIVVQGGTFRNDAVYRALELLSGKKVSSSDRPELMGAIGAALYARGMWEKAGAEFSSAGIYPLPDPLNIDTREIQCKGCTNGCTVLRFRFANGNTCYAGNKCEKVFHNTATAAEKGYNAFDYKNTVLFGAGEGDDASAPTSTDTGKIRRTVIGIPRVLNMFENYPFWETLLTSCGFRVVLSPESDFPLYRTGVGSVMSDNICFPAKLVHGHIMALADRKVDRIFYPIIPKEVKEFAGANNSYNCPVVSGYPDVVRSSMETEEKHGIPLDKPVITMHDPKTLERSCIAYLKTLGVDRRTALSAFVKALARRDEIRKKLADDQRRAFDKVVARGELAVVVAGRPYHADPLVNQKIGQILSDLGAHAFTDDIFRSSASAGFGELKIVSQWSYPDRVVQAAMEVAKMPHNVQLIQLNSFGCGPDSFFMDETREILNRAGKNHTLIRIDEISSPGSVRLRLRSLIESLNAAGPGSVNMQEALPGVSYTKEDRRKTILAPWFSDFISPFIPALGEIAGYRIVNLPRSDKHSADNGLKYGHNEVCYPSTLVLGDIITALQSGNFDLEDTVVAITQTGGQCRATNYIAQIKNGLQSAGFSEVPVIVLSSGEVFQNDQKGFKVPLMKLINITVYGLLYADAMQQMYSSLVIREKEKGATKKTFDRYIEKGIEVIRRNDRDALCRTLREAVRDFNSIDIDHREYARVGLIGEIYVKYNDFGQAHTTEWLRSKGVDVMTPPIIDFIMQYFVNTRVNIRNGVANDSMLGKLLRPVFWKYMNDRIRRMEAIMKDFRFYTPSESIFTKAEYASDILDLSNQFGEGWCIAAEVAHYARQGVNKIVCVQPFGCIANHIVAKGIEKRIKKLYPEVDMLYLDVDGGMAEVNLQNRLHFLM